MDCGPAVLTSLPMTSLEVLYVMHLKLQGFQAPMSMTVGIPKMPKTPYQSLLRLHRDLQRYDIIRFFSAIAVALINLFLAM